MEVGNARKWQAFFVDYLKINLWVLASLSTAKQKLEIRREDYGLNNPTMVFSLPYVFLLHLSLKYIFVFSVLETFHQSFSWRAFVEGFSLFSLQLLEWMHSYFPPYLSLFCLIFLPLALNTTLMFELRFMRCDSEAWLPRQTVWTGT